MKRIYNYISVAVIMAAGVSLQSCSSEDPYVVSSGDGILCLNTQLKSDIKISTRAEIVGYTEEQLNNSLVVYIENEKGVIRKYLGKNTIPSTIVLPVGKYVVEGWTGDSVSASYDKKFFRGYMNDVNIGEGSNEISLNLNIANVIVSVDEKSLNNGIEDLNVKIYHSRGELSFKEEDVIAKKRGYFMMPNADNDLNYIITGKNQLGKEFEKTGTIAKVQRSHQYNLLLSADESQVEQGGALIRLEIQDIPVIEESVEMLSAPSFLVTVANQLFDMEDQVVSTDKKFSDVRVRALAYGSLGNLTVSFSDNFEGMESINGKNLRNDNNALSALSEKGIKLEVEHTTDPSHIQGNVDIEAVEAWFTFPGEFLNSLPEDTSSEYTITFKATDGRSLSNTAVLRISNSEATIERKAPVGSGEAPDVNNNPMAILANSAELTGYLYSDEITDYGIIYREKGTEEFTKVSALSTRASTYNTFTVKLTGLQPGKTYEYKSYADDYEEKDVKTFTTESKFNIPNASMEDWSNYTSKIIIPGANGERTFWDTGNHGSATMSVTLTNKTSDMHGNGQYAALLHSQYVGLGGSLGKFAAGNLFVGEYVKTDGTNGILSFGRPYNSSHPTALRVKVNYRPKTATGQTKGDYVKEGQMDEGQIYIALVSEPIEIRTNPKNLKLFTTDDPVVLAYGQKTFTDNFGEDNQLLSVDIPITYFNRAKSSKPSHIVIVCSASKYGDFFCGGEGSEMCLDDFELIYDGDLQFE